MKRREKINKAGVVAILDRFVDEKGYRPAVSLFATFVKAINASDIDMGPQASDIYYRSLSGFVDALPAFARNTENTNHIKLTIPLLSVMTTDAIPGLVDPFLLPFIQKHQLDRVAWTVYEKLVSKGGMVSLEIEDALQLHETPYEERQAIEKLLASGLAEKDTFRYIRPALPLSPKLLRFMVNQPRVKEDMKAKKYERGSAEYFRALFVGTLFEPLFEVELPFVIPQKTRSEHGWILAPQGMGKTQLIQYLVTEDLPAVARGERSVVVMDSSGDMIKQIKSLALFAPDGALSGKLTVVEPDVEYPLALNIFDMGRSRLSSYSPRAKQKLQNNTLDLLLYVFNSLMGEGATMTPKQSTLFRYCVRLCMVIPGATLQTLVDLMNAEDMRDYKEHLGKLDATTQTFFRNQFFDPKQFASTKQEVAWCLMLLLEDATFQAMFTAPRSRFDLFTELNASRVILINTDKDLLKEERTAIFGRFFIALLLSASQERAELERTERLPVHCYIDEAQDYIRTDPKFTTILDQARKMNVGMMVANQRTQQITGTNVLDALLTTSIKFVHTDNDRDANTVARPMRTSASFIASQARQHFAVYVRELTDQAVSVKVPFLVMEGMKKMTKAQAKAVEEEMRERYARKPDEIASEPADELNAVASEPPEDGKKVSRSAPASSSDGLRPERDII